MFVKMAKKEDVSTILEEATLPDAESIEETLTAEDST